MGGVRDRGFLGGKGMGVPAKSVDTADDMVAELRRSLAKPGPALIEALLE